jgi:hypothetical protein
MSTRQRIALVIEEMAGSDRVPDPTINSESGWKAQTHYESEMALFSECMPSCAQIVLDIADIVRDGDFATTTLPSGKNLTPTCCRALVSGLRRVRPDLTLL